ncbi:MAG: hypothetical protein QOF78_2370, partial [Phycisphaerales bacterium]|nr:hypothetical protein [Phycisphaerales bacterium]
MKPNRSLIAVPLLALFIAVHPLAAQKVEVTNNQSFPIAMPVKLLSDGTTVMVNVDANAKQTIDLRAKGAEKVAIEPVESGVRLKTGAQDLGTFSWDLLFKKLDKTPDDADIDQTKRDYEKLFAPLPMKFASTGKKDLFETFAAESSKNGLKLRVELDVYPAGFVDVRATFTNESAPKTNVYAAVITRWQQPNVAARSVNYNNQTLPLPDDGATPFRKGGGNARLRHMVVQRGVDWINCSLGGASVTMLNDFAPSFTIHKDPKG